MSNAKPGRARRRRAINVVLIGAHPDDCELTAGGTCALWARSGFRVLLVSVTNGDAGHHEMAGAPLAERRRAEARLSAQRGGVESLVLDNHDGRLQPTLEMREQIVQIIRQYEADLVITHRPNDYHPDHRYTSQVVQDSAYMVTVPNFCPEYPALRKNPVYLYLMDGFRKPNRFEADIAVAVDDTMDTKWQMLDAMESQVYEWLPWHAGTLSSVPANPEERLTWLKATWNPLFVRPAENERRALKRWYGKHAAEIVYAELFEVSEYGARPTKDDILRLFPFLAQRPSKRKKSSKKG